MSERSKLKRAQKRKATHQQLAREFDAWGPKLIDKLAAEGVPGSEINRRMERALLWSLEARKNGFTASAMAFNIGRIMHGHEPLERRQAVQPPPARSRSLALRRGRS